MRYLLARVFTFADIRTKVRCSDAETLHYFDSLSRAMPNIISGSPDDGKATTGRPFKH
jgi:hypothetical protein